MILTLDLTQLAPAYDFVRAHPAAALATVLVSTGIGANLAARVFNWIPMDRWFSLLEMIGRGASRAGGMRLSRPVWEPFEAWLLKALSGSVAALARGMQSDSQPNPTPKSGQDRPLGDASSPPPRQGMN